MSGALIDTAEMLELGGYDPDDRLSLSWSRLDGSRRVQVLPVSEIPAMVDKLAVCDVWIGTNPLHERVPPEYKKGGARDVVAIRCLYADLDVGPGKLPSFDAAHAVIAELSAMLGDELVTVVHSGHGLQPRWKVERDESTEWPDETDERWINAQALMRRWNRLVARVALAHGGPADNVSNLDRILRAPNTSNRKSEPVQPVVAIRGDGVGVALDRLAEVLDEQGVESLDIDRQAPGDVVSEPGDWEFAAQTCGYVVQVVNGWEGADDGVTQAGGRNPYMFGQLVRLAAFHRFGCITQHDYERGAAAIVGKFRWALANVGETRKERPDEVSGAMHGAVALVSAKSPQQLADEVGHEHREADASWEGVLPPEWLDGNGQYVAGAVTPAGPLESARAKLAALDPQARANLRVMANADIVAQGWLTADELAAIDAAPGPTPRSGLKWDGISFGWFDHNGDPYAGPWMLWDGTQLGAQAAPAWKDYGELYLPRSELAKLPRGEPLIENVLDRHALAVLSGRDKSYKSFGAISWACCLATGTPWLGYEVERTRCMLIIGEGAWGLDDRIAAWETAWQTTVDDDWLTIRRAPVNLAQPMSEPFLDLVRRVREGEYGLVVFDTLQRCSSGADTNSARDAGTIIGALDEVRQATANGSVVTVAHTGKSDLDTRGSSVFEDDSDIVWHFARDEDEQSITVQQAKRKDGPDGLTLSLRPRLVAGTDSLVLEVSGGAGDLEAKPPPKGTLDVLKALAGSSVPTDGLGATAIGDALGMAGKGSIHRILGWLIDAEYVQIVESGRWPTYKITVPGSSKLAEIGEGAHDLHK